MQSHPVGAILAHQNQAGHWGRPASSYNRKYRGTAWQVIILAQLGADGQDERIHNACEFLFRRSQSADTGGFAIGSNRSQSGGGRGCLPCLTGNLVRAMRQFGYADDPRWRHAVRWLVANQQSDGGWATAGTGAFRGASSP